MEINEKALFSSLYNDSNFAAVSNYFIDEVICKDFKNDEEMASVKGFLKRAISIEFYFAQLITTTDSDMIIWAKAYIIHNLIWTFSGAPKMYKVMGIIADESVKTADNMVDGTPMWSELDWYDIDLNGLLSMLKEKLIDEDKFKEDYTPKSLLECMLGARQFDELTDTYGDDFGENEEDEVEVEENEIEEVIKNDTNSSNYFSINFMVRTNYKYDYDELKLRFIHRFDYKWGAKILNYNMFKVDGGYDVSILIDAKGVYTFSEMNDMLNYRFGANSPRKWYATRDWSIGMVDDDVRD